MGLYSVSIQKTYIPCSYGDQQNTHGRNASSVLIPPLVTAPVLDHLLCESSPATMYTATGACCSSHIPVVVHSYRETLFPCSSSTLGVSTHQYPLQASPLTSDIVPLWN